MHELARNQLVWLDARAWEQIGAMSWDEQARDLLAHWRANRLPLVVTRQRNTVAPTQVCLGLPAPQRWSRRRLALTIDRAHVDACGHFPTLTQVAQALRWEQPACDWAQSIVSLGVSARVYGSHGWQWLTGLTYLHPDSDLDLRMEVGSWAMAGALVQLLDAAASPARVDGEIVFAGGQALAWREWSRLLKGQTAKVMVKERHRVWLATLAQARALAGDGVDQARLVATASH